MKVPAWMQEYIDALNLMFSKLVDIVWFYIMIVMCILAFVLPFFLIFIILSVLGFDQFFNIQNIPRFPAGYTWMIPVIIVCSMPYYYLYKLRNETLSTSYKIFFMLAFWYSAGAIGSNLVINEYHSAAKQSSASAVKICALDAETREPVKAVITSWPLNESNEGIYKTRWKTKPSSEELEIVLWGCKPISIGIGSSGYKSKDISLDPVKDEDITVELQKIKSAREK